MAEYWLLLHVNMGTPRSEIYSSDALKQFFGKMRCMKKESILLLSPDLQEKHMILNNLKLWSLKFFHALDRAVAQCCIWLIVQSRPLFGPGNICPFVIGCTQYAILEFESSIVPVAFWRTTLRLLRCNPLWLYWHSKT